MVEEEPGWVCCSVFPDLVLNSTYFWHTNRFNVLAFWGGFKRVWSLVLFDKPVFEGALLIVHHIWVQIFYYLLKKYTFQTFSPQKMMTNKCRMKNMYFWNSTIECGCKQFRPKHQVKIWTLKFFFQRQQINCENELLQVQLAQKKTWRICRCGALVIELNLTFAVELICTCCRNAEWMCLGFGAW